MARQFVALGLALSSAGAAPSVAPTDPRLVYEGRWVTEADGARVADWPCSGLSFGVNSTRVALTWSGVRTRLRVVAYDASGRAVSDTVLAGPPVDLPWGGPRRDELSLPPGAVRVSVRKLTSATPYSMGVGRILSPSVLSVHGVEADVVAPGGAAAPRRAVGFVGASDTAGYCVDGTVNTTSLGDTLLGWEYSDCDGAYPAVLGRRLGADVSVQALAGAGLTQNADAARAWQIGALTMGQLFDRALQTRTSTWNASAPVDLVVVSLGGNDFNHQDGRVPSNETFSAAYASLLDRIFETSPGLTAVAAVCGMGSPAEAAFDPDNNRCRPCAHVGDAVAAYSAQRPTRRVEFIFVPCDGTVVDDDGDIGCDGHKNAKGQAEVAEFLEPKLRALAGW